MIKCIQRQNLKIECVNTKALKNGQKQTIHTYIAIFVVLFCICFFFILLHFYPRSENKSIANLISLNLHRYIELFCRSLFFAGFFIFVFLVAFKLLPLSLLFSLSSAISHYYYQIIVIILIVGIGWVIDE